MKCEICGKECKGRTCSGACRAKLSRRTRTGLNSAQVKAHDNEITERTRTVESEAHAPVVKVKPAPVQHTNPMMIGYEPPEPV